MLAARPALLPSDYCGDVHLRLSFYKKLASAKSGDQIDGLLEELDRLLVVAGAIAAQVLDAAQQAFIGGELRLVAAALDQRCVIGA